MLAGVDADKASPDEVARRVVAALEAGETMVFPDDTSAKAGEVYLSDPVQLEKILAS